MRFSRPYFDIDAYASGKHCGSAPCTNCGATATAEYCDTGGQCSPGRLDIWYPLCFECRNTPVPTWETTTCEMMNAMLTDAGMKPLFSSRSGENQ